MSYSHYKLFSAIRKFKNNRNLERVLKRRLATQDTNEYQHGMQKFVPRYDKRLNDGGDCVGQQRNSSKIKRKLFFLRTEIKNANSVRCKLIC
jgi:hypothetical protein